MGKTSSKQRFSFEGRFLGFVDSKQDPPKFLRLATAQGEAVIKLSKPLRKALPKLVPGEWIHVMGRQKLYSKSDTPSFKAKEILLRSPRDPSIPTKSPAANIGDSACDAPLDPASNQVTDQSVKPKAEAIVSSGREQPQPSILICQKSKCCRQGGTDLYQTLKTTLRDRGLADQVAIKGTGCMKRCKKGPNLIVMPAKARYSQIRPAQVDALVNQHFSVSS